MEHDKIIVDKPKPVLTNTKAIDYNNRISRVKQTVLLLYIELKDAITSKMYLVFILMMLLPMLFTLISFALTQYPEYLNEVNIQNFLNSPFYLLQFSNDGAINTFRALFSSAMGLYTGGGFQNLGFATIFYANVPMFAPVTVLCCGIIAGDREKGTLKIYASKPIYRTQLVLIRFLAFALISLLFTTIVYFCMYFVYAISIFGKMNLIIAGIAETIDMPINLTLLTWLFILATGSITTLLSSLLNRAVFAAIVSLTLLFGLTMLITIMMLFVGALAEPLKYLDLTTVVYSLMNDYILGFVFWDAIFDVIVQYGYTDVFTTVFLGQFVDSTVGMIEFISLVILPLVAACVITEKREIH